MRREKVYIPLRDVGYRTWKRRKLAVLVTLLAAVLEIGFLIQQERYLASGDITIGAFANFEGGINKPPSYKPVEDINELERYVNNILLPGWALNRKCTSKGFQNNEPMLRISCSANSDKESRDALSRIADAIDKRHRKLFAIEEEYAEYVYLDRRNRMDRITARIKSLPSSTGRRTDAGSVMLLQYRAGLEDQYTNIENDAKLDDFSRQHRRYSAMKPESLRVEHRQLVFSRILASLLVAVSLGVLTSFSLALGESIRDREETLSARNA